MNGNLRSSLAVGRFSGFLLRHASTNSLNSLEYLDVDNVGGGFLGIKNKTFIGCIVEFGGSPSANSIAVIPKDQISAFASYADCFMTSGAIQNGVPTKVFLLEVVLV